MMIEADAERLGSFDTQTTDSEPPELKSLVVNVVIVGLFEEEEDGSDVVRVKHGDLATSGFRRGDRARWHVVDQFRGYVLSVGPSLRQPCDRNDSPILVKLNKTKQATQEKK